MLKKIGNVAWAIVGILSIGVMTLLVQKIVHRDNVYYHTRTIEKIYFSKEEFKYYLQETNIKFPEIVYAQAILESGNFNSAVFKKYNNVFGMKRSSERPTTALYYENGYAVYRTWRESVLDYALYQSYYHNDIDSVEEYYRALSNYAEDTLYINKLKTLRW